MKYPFMPLFLGDLLADTLNLSAHDFGAYMLLILHAWKHEAKIPIKDLKRVARVSSYNWPRCRDRVVQFFNTHRDPNFWHHERVALELLHADEISNKRKDAAVQMHAKKRANASGLHGGLHMHPHSHQNKNSSTRNSYSGDTAPARSLAVKPSARSPASTQNGSYGREPDPFVIDDAEYAQRLNPPVKPGQITKLPE